MSSVAGAGALLAHAYLMDPVASEYLHVAGPRPRLASRPYHHLLAAASDSRLSQRGSVYICTAKDFGAFAFITFYASGPCTAQVHSWPSRKKKS